MQILISLRTRDNAFDEIAKFKRVASERADLAALLNFAMMAGLSLNCSDTATRDVLACRKDSSHPIAFCLTFSL
jgi:hypothetical protein